MAEVIKFYFSPPLKRGNLLTKGAQPGISRAGKVAGHKRTSTNISPTTNERKAAKGKILELFLPDALKTAF